MHSILMSETQFHLVFSTYFLFKNVPHAEGGKCSSAHQEVSCSVVMERYSALHGRGKPQEEIIDHGLSDCCEAAGFNLMLFLFLFKTEGALTLDALVFKLCFEEP